MSAQYENFGTHKNKFCIPGIFTMIVLNNETILVKKTVKCH